MFTALREYMLRWCPVAEVRKKVAAVKGGGNRCEVKLSADGAVRRVAGLEVIVLDDLPETE
jgi:hypothetical protein